MYDEERKREGGGERKRDTSLADRMTYKRARRIPPFLRIPFPSLLAATTLSAREEGRGSGSFYRLRRIFDSLSAKSSCKTSAKLKNSRHTIVVWDLFTRNYYHGRNYQEGIIKMKLCAYKKENTFRALERAKLRFSKSLP